MNGIKCTTLSSFVRSIQHQRNFVPLVMPRRSEWHYSSKEGVPREIITMLTQEYDFSMKGIQAYLEKSRWKAVKEDHKFVAERHKTLGPDLATAHFLVTRGAKVKFFGRNAWFKKDEKGNIFLPNQYIQGMHLEAIDICRMQWSYVAFDNMIELEHLRYLNFSGCCNFDDWSLAKMYQFRNSLEFLDISDCWQVTEHGLACLHVLKKLKGLKLSGLPNVRNLGLMVVLLEECLPECTIFGIDEKQLNVPKEDMQRELSDRRDIIIKDHGDRPNNSLYKIMHHFKFKS